MSSPKSKKPAKPKKAAIRQLAKPVSQKFNMSVMAPKSPPNKLHQQSYCEVIASWAHLEFSCSGALLAFMGVADMDVAEVIIGTLPVRGRLDKIIKLAKLKGVNSDIVKEFNQLKKGLQTPTIYRNLISHVPTTGWDKKDKDVVYLKSFKKSNNPYIQAYRLTYTDLKFAGEQILDAGNAILPITAKALNLKFPR